MFNTLHCNVGVGVARPTHRTEQCSLPLMQCACIITDSMPSMGNKLLVQYPIYKHHALRPMALRLGACKSDIAIARV